jgi:hypothetical protein
MNRARRGRNPRKNPADSSPPRHRVTELQSYRVTDSRGFSHRTVLLWPDGPGLLWPDGPGDCGRCRGRGQESEPVTANVSLDGGDSTQKVQRSQSRSKRRATGIPGGDSLSALLARQRGGRSWAHRPKLQSTQILNWADEYRLRNGTWPSADSGTIPNSDGDTWAAVDAALVAGNRGLPPSSVTQSQWRKERKRGKEAS